MAEPLPDWQGAFLEQHRLHPAYLDSALKWFAPLGELLAEHHNGAQRPLLVGVNGCQGSGKSTLCDFLCHWLLGERELRAVALSLDDFYLTLAERTYLHGGRILSVDHYPARFAWIDKEEMKRQGVKR